MLTSCDIYPGPCSNMIAVVNRGESGEILGVVHMKFPDGGTYCFFCSSFVCKDHASKNFHQTCTLCDDEATQTEAPTQEEIDGVRESEKSIVEHGIVWDDETVDHAKKKALRDDWAEKVRAPFALVVDPMVRPI